METRVGYVCEGGAGIRIYAKRGVWVRLRAAKKVKHWRSWDWD